MAVRPRLGAPCRRPNRRPGTGPRGTRRPESLNSKAKLDKKVDLETARKLAVERTIKVHLQNAFNYNRNRRDVELKEGQIVYCKLASKVNRENYGDIYEGPFEIKRMVSKNRFEIEKNGKTVVVNKANLRLIL